MRLDETGIMAIKLICGPAGSGKTRKAIEYFLSALDRGERAAFIAPSGPDARHFQRRILTKQSVLTNGKVITFDDLRRDLLQGSGKTSPLRIISDSERFMLLMAVAREPGQLETLKQSAEYDGFINQLGGLIAELEELGIEPARLGRELKKWAGRDAWRRGFNQDLFRLYDEYRAILEEHSAQDRELASRQAVANLIEEPTLLGYNAVIVDGFYDFTPSQLDLIRHLGQSIPELLLTLPYEKERVAAAATARFHDMFAGGADVSYLEAVSGDREPALSHLNRNLFEEEAGMLKAGQAIVKLGAAGDRGQAEQVAAEVLKLWREQGISLDDIAIVTRAPGADSRAIASVFSDFGIPFDMAAPLPLIDTLVGRTAAVLLDIVARRGGRDSLLYFLRSPLSGADRNKVDGFDRYVRTNGTVDLSTLLWEWSRWSGAPLAGIDQLGKAARKDIGSLSSELLDLMRRLVQEKTERGCSLDDVELDVLSLKVLASVCGEALLLDEKVGKTETPARLLRAGIEKAIVRPRSGTRRGCVRLLDPHRVLNQRFEVIFVCGLLEGCFPALGPESAFLGEADRKWLRDSCGLPLETREQRLEKEKFLFYRTLTRAGRKIYLCHPYCDKDGKPTVASLFVHDVLDLFEDNSWDEAIKQIGEVVFPVAEAPSPRQALLSLASMNPQMGGAGSITGAAASQLAAAPLIDAAKTAGLDRQLDQIIKESVTRKTQIGEEVKDQFASLELFRVTDLEQYLKCPFGFFINMIVRPQQTDPEDLVLRRGSSVHRILEKFFTSLKRAEVRLSTADATQILAARRIMATIVEEHTAAGTDLESIIMKVELAAHLDRFVDRELKMRPLFEPHRMEWSFGICDGKPEGRFDEETMLKIGGFKICGRIDRVDVRRGKNQAVVIDYKASRDDYLPRSDQMEKNGAIQVPIYMVALRDIWGLEPIGGEYCSILGKRRRGIYLKQHESILGLDTSEPYVGDFVEAGVFDKMLETAKSLALEAMMGIRAAHFPSRPRDPKACDHCRLGDICRDQPGAYSNPVS